MLTKEKPDFSVVITAYNKERFIAEAIKSVLNQSYQDFELIVIDDGSTDNTRDIVLSFSDARIRYVYQENSSLPACARNKGMSLSKGKYIALLDGDDYWHLDKLDNCKKILDNRPEVSLVCHNEAIIYNGRVLRHTSYGPYREQMYKELLFGGNCLHASAVVMHRAIFFDDVVRFSEEKSLFTIEDYEYWLRLSKKYRFYFLPDILGFYRITESGIFLQNIEENTLNMLNLLNNHFVSFGGDDRNILKKIKIRKSSIMCAAGRMYQHNNSFQKSKIWYAKAICENPFNYKAMVGYLAASFNLRILYR